VDRLDEQLTSVGALAEPVRRALDAYVAGETEPVSREQAATAVDVPLHTAKFHLDRLVDAGLLDVEYRRLSGRTGPGAGRPAKLYRRSSRQLSVSLPERRYDLVGGVLAEAVDESLRTGAPITETLAEVARSTGRRIADTYQADRQVGAHDDVELETVAGILGHCGYEPALADQEICLVNCPFDRLATEHTELVCGMNRDLVEGVIDGAGAESLQARLAPEAGFCCVRVGT
jgi:predicted ArsR family transcriptional regulator